MIKPNQNIAVIYARYSSQKQNDESIEQQVEVCQEYAKLNGLTIIQIYADRATTGRNDKREQFQRMVADSKLGHFGTIIAYKSNRISRDMTQALLYHNVMTKNGVRIVYAKETFDDSVAGRFMMREMMNLNQFYSENLGEDVKRGMSMNAKEEKAQSRPLFGYKIENGQFAIDEDRAEVVRKVFNLYIDGMRPKEILDHVKYMRRSNGKPLNEHSIRTMLSQPQYFGNYAWNGVAYDNFPAIISKETFDKVQEERKLNVNHPQRHRSEDVYIFSGKLICATCNQAFTGYSGKSHTGSIYKYYRCKNKNCPHRLLRKDKLEDLVFEQTRAYCLNDKYIDDISRQVYQYMLRQRQSDSEIAETKRKLNDIESRLANILHAIELGNTTAILVERLNELEREKAKLTEQLEKVSKPLSVSEKDIKTVLRNYTKAAAHSDEETYHKMLENFIYMIEVRDDSLLIYFNIFKDESKKETPADLASVEVSEYTILVTHSGTKTNFINGYLVLVVPFSRSYYTHG